MSPADDFWSEAGTQATVAGWGSTSTSSNNLSPVLRYANVKVSFLPRNILPFLHTLRVKFMKLAETISKMIIDGERERLYVEKNIIWQ